MTVAEAELAPLNKVCGEARIIEEGGVTYVYLAELRLPPGCGSLAVDALLRPGPGPDGYTSRLFLSSPFVQKGQNWTIHRIADRAWHAFSYNNVPSDIPLIEILANHLSVLK